MKRVFDAGLLLFHLDFSGSSNIDHRDTADQLGQALLQFLTIVVRGRFIDLSANLFNAPLEIGFLAGAIDDGRVVLVDDDSFGAAEILESNIV